MIYDHEREAEPLRERPVADWGGDDLFTSTPRRFARHAGGRPRGSAVASGGHMARRGAALDSHHGERGSEDAALAPAPHVRRFVAEEVSPPIVTGDQAVVALAPEAVAARRTVSRWSAADDADLAERAGAVIAGGAGVRDGAGSPIPQAPPASLVPAQPPQSTAPAAGRRTVTITGRPGATAAPVRRRPAPTVHDHLGGRPDRIAAWAFGLGLTLILIAVGTADAAPL